MTEQHPAVAYLERALAEAEQQATAASDGQGWWLINPRYADHRTVAEYVIEGEHGTVAHIDVQEHDAEAHRAEVLLIQSNSPRATLRRVAADRRILAEHASDGYGDCVRCADAGLPVDCGEYGTGLMRTELPWPCRTVLDLADGWGWEVEA